MEPTDGMVRGMKAIDLGEPITVPVGKATLGRVMNVIGEPVDKLGPIVPKRGIPSTAMLPSWKSRIPRWKCSRRG